ncbi:hypothetical protein M2366_001879 [Aeromonas sp. BIGb0405]|uniref:DUF4123 domain-containing protein n=1 Tax=Aeromonas sp. BIGb0405 TaxID=2940592 RepID=UPI002167E4D7|nr:DUF4123 domain-containing protein [Aeromonas sp. BIGb0405]MCS3455798.1 hypothetical protein [Aeromonas sp. BIGb0405]
MQSCLTQTRPDIQLSDSERLYLLLDGGQIAALEQSLFEVEGSPDYQPLYLYHPWDSLREASPCLVSASAALLEWFMEKREPSWGYLLSSPLSLLPLAESLRTLIEAESPYGSRVLLKLAMPETAWRLFDGDDGWLWQGVSQVWIPIRAGWQHKQVPSPLSPRQGDRLRLTDEQWTRLGEVSWQHTLDAISRHMATWFPARLAEQLDASQWVAQWAQWGYDKGFQSERDLLLMFNVLGYLGLGAMQAPDVASAQPGEDEHADIRQLILSTSSQTPSQRIERAAELAQTRVQNKKERVA